MAITFVLSDESVNSYGTRILTEGIDLSLFSKNPIMLWMHNRVWAGREDEVLPIGKWENVRIQGKKLLADAVFDEKDEFAQRIASKVEQGIINMASIGVNIIATSEDASVLVKGQTRPTIVKCLITEASICDIGSNRNALRMCDELGVEINLADTAGDNHLLPMLNLSVDGAQDQTNQNQSDMNLRETISGALGLSGITSDEQLLAKIKEMHASHSEQATRLAAYEKAEKDAAEAACVALVDSAIKERRITADVRETYLGFARADFDGTKTILDKMPAAAELTAGHPGEAPVDAWAARKEEIRNNNQNQ